MCKTSSQLPNILETVTFALDEKLNHRFAFAIFHLAVLEFILAFHFIGVL